MSRRPVPSAYGAAGETATGFPHPFEGRPNGREGGQVVDPARRLIYLQPGRGLSGRVPADRSSTASSASSDLKKEHGMTPRLDRRRFLQATSIAGFGIFVPGARGRSPNERLNFACIGVGGKGSSDIDQAGELGDIVALCDIDDAAPRRRRPRSSPRRRRTTTSASCSTRWARRSTPSSSARPTTRTPPAAVMAMRLGKHVYCQKPLTHSVVRGPAHARDGRARRRSPRRWATRGRPTPGSARGVELIRSGVVGPVREVHVWTNRPIKYWPQAPDIVARPEPTPPVPPARALGPLARPGPRAAVPPGLPPVRLARLVGLRHRRPGRHGLPHGQPAVHGA